MPEKWDEIAEIFSRDAVLKGSFDKYAVSTKGKRGTTEVDNAFLAEIEGWRDLTRAQHRAAQPDLTQRELNFAVQHTIDRIIFLRICEDRGIEHYGRLHGAAQRRQGLRRACVSFFEQADDRYNSGLFHFSKEKGRHEAPDELTLASGHRRQAPQGDLQQPVLPGQPLRVLRPRADILGQVYEQFLGKVIRLTSGHRAVVEDKPEVKKAGGVYYTPTYIVDYIVRQTVGKLLEGKTPSKQAASAICASSIRPAAPARSSSARTSILLDWHLARYLADGPEKHGKGKSRAHPSRPHTANGG